MNQQVTIGHNGAPDPIDEAVAPYLDVIEEAENWLDGEPIQTEDQMKAVDALIKQLRTANSDLAKAKKSSTAPLHDVWKAEIARWKPTEDDMKMRQEGLVALVAPIKKRLADEKEAAKRAAYEEAQRLEREAKARAAAADASNLAEQQEAAEAIQKANDAKNAAMKANRDTVKGMRTVYKHEIENMQALVNWIAKHDKPAIAEFATAYAAKHHKETPMDGVRAWSEKEAY